MPYEIRQISRENDVNLIVRELNSILVDIDVAVGAFTVGATFSAIDYADYPGGVVLLPGEYAIDDVRTSSKLKWTGRGTATSLIRPAQFSAGDPIWIDNSEAGLELRDLSVTFEPDGAAPSRPTLFTFGPDVVLDRCFLDGGAIADPDTGALNSNQPIWTTINSGDDYAGFHMENSTAVRWVYGPLHGNSSTGMWRDIRILNSDFDEMCAPYLLFNFPATGARADNILIFGNKLGSNLSKYRVGLSPLGLTAHRGSFAGHVTYSRLIANHANGPGEEMFRTEESAYASVWALNTAELEGRDGFEFIGSNVGGSDASPSRFAILGNVLDNKGLNTDYDSALGRGIFITSTSGETIPGLHDSVLSANVMHGWATGYSFGHGSHRILSADNVSAGNAQGIQTFEPSVGIKDTLIVDATTAAVQFEKGGLIGKTHFRVSTDGFTAQVIDINAGPAGVMGWSAETNAFEIANTADTVIEIIPRGYLIDADITVVFDGSASHNSVERGRLTWDGTTLTYSRRYRRSTGTVILNATSPIGYESGTGNLAININNTLGSALDGCRLQVIIDGVHMWS